MGILDDDLGCPSRTGSFAGGKNLVRHQLAELGVVCMIAIGFVPVGDTGRSFDVG